MFILLVSYFSSVDKAKNSHYLFFEHIAVTVEQLFISSAELVHTFYCLESIIQDYGICLLLFILPKTKHPAPLINLFSFDNVTDRPLSHVLLALFLTTVMPYMQYFKTFLMNIERKVSILMPPSCYNVAN